MTQQTLTAAQSTESIQLNNSSTLVKTQSKSSKAVKQLAPSVFYNKGRNIVYLGCNADEVERYLKSIGNFYRCEEMTVRKPKYNTDFEREIVIRDMYAEANFYAYGLDSLVNEQNLKHLDRGGWQY